MAEAERKIFRERRVTDSFDEQEFSTSSVNFSRNFRPLKSGGSNFHSEQFSFQPDKITVKPTKAVSVISRIVFCIGLLIIAAALIAGQFAPAIFLILFFSIFFWVFKFISTQNRAEFDLQNNCFYPCGRKMGKKYHDPFFLSCAASVYVLFHNAFSCGKIQGKILYGVLYRQKDLLLFPALHSCSPAYPCSVSGCGGKIDIRDKFFFSAAGDAVYCITASSCRKYCQFLSFP